MKRINWIKRVTSFILVFMMVFGMMPWYDITSYAADPVVNKIQIMKTYKEGYNVASLYYLTIYGTDLNTLEVKIQQDSGELDRLTPSESGKTSVQYEIPLGKEGSVFEINGDTYDLSEGDMPRIKGVTKTLIKAGEKLGISAEKLDKIGTTGDTTIKVEYFRGTNNQDISAELQHTDDSLQTKEITVPTGIVGSQHMEVVKEYKKGIVEVKIQYRYLDAFRIYDDISIPSEIKIFPNKSKVGDKVTIKTETLPESSYSVFLVKQEIDPLLGKNLGIDIQTYQHPSNDDTITFKVPNLTTGTYEVILTNPINSSGINPDTNFTNQIIKQKNIGKFTIVDGKFLPEIQKASPNSGPDSGSEVKIYGKYFEELNIDGLINVNDNDIKPDKLDIFYDNEDKIEKLKIDYDTDGSSKYDGKAVTNVERRISVIIGSVVEFYDKKEPDTAKAKAAAIAKQDFKNGANEFDSLSVIVKPLETSDKDTIKDVQVNIETIITADGKEYKIYESALKSDAYEYIKSFTDPVVDTVKPDTILVKETGGIYKTTTDVIFSIRGKDFNVYKYTDDNSKEIINYPKVVIGVNDENVDKNNEIVMKRIGNDVYIHDKDTNSYKINTNARLEVLDSQGRMIDGSFGREVGDKIVVKIPSGLIINKEKVNVSAQTIGIGNPIRKSENHVPLVLKGDAVRFVETKDVPIIENVDPNVVTVNGGEEVEITGSNYKNDVKVYIDGEEITGIKRQGDGKKITLTAPSGREGDTLIYVINPSNGGIATYPFRYVETYTQPKIIDFSPKKGKTGTLVVVKGENLMSPDPTALEKDISKLIGTTVLLEGKDINEYNKNDNTKEIELQDYTATDANKIFRVEDNNLITADYYHSIILKDESTNKFYTINVDVKGNPILSNGVDKRYAIKYDGSAIKADKDADRAYPITIKNDSIVINETTPITLKFKTPFKIEGDKIVGDNVKVVNSETLYFRVPILEADGYYDVTIQNPDTKKDSKVNESGFYYYTQPSTLPKITSIHPNQGSVDGGYTITIQGGKTEGKECFVDNGNDKTQVFINGVEVEANNVKVSTDGLSIEAVVPTLDIDLRDKYNTDRLTVPVVVVNPDGGSDSVEDGFTYVVPSSHPEITKLMPTDGKASGDEVVEILGKDFRFFEPYNDEDRSQTWDKGEEYKDLNKYKIKFDGIDEAEDLSNTKGPDDFSNKTFDNLKQLYKKADGTLDEQKFKERITPVLPKVYFGNKQAEIIEFGNGYLKVKTPSVEQAGAVDVYIVNNDAGRSNKVKYTYRSSNPKIDKIIPNQGKKQGKDNIEIIGSDFAKTDIKIAQKQPDGKLKPNDNFQKQTLVKFGEITNKDIQRDQPNSGLINNSRTTVNLAGGLSISYDGSNDKVVITVNEGDKTYTNELIEYKDEVVYVPVDLLKDKDGVSYTGYELIRLEVSDRRLIVERGYSPQTTLLNDGQIEVKTPSYYTIGVVPVTIINPDKGEASGQFEYKNPASSPEITEITRDGQPSVADNINGKDVKVVKVNYKGGSIISVIGFDFRENAKISIGNIMEVDYANMTPNLPNKLTFKIDAVDESEIGKLHKVVVQNEDGAFASSDEPFASSDEPTIPIYIMFTKGETTPKIDTITPNKGLSKGGKPVTIKGLDFRKTMEGYEPKKITVYFGEIRVPDADIEFIDYKTIVVRKTPKSDPKTVDVKVENPDGELSNSVEYTYLSDPHITQIVDAKDKNITTIFVDGGEEIQIKGNDFMSGARVVFNPVLKAATDSDTDIINIVDENGEIKRYVLVSGIEGSAEFIDSQNLKVTTPAGKLGSKGVMIINTDKAGSETYDIVYVIDQIDAPKGVKAELIYDKYIKIDWNEVTDATSYEIYAVEDGKEMYLVGTTDLTTFIYRDVKSKTDYRFIVKAIGEFGLSKGSSKSNEVTTKSHSGYDDKDGEINEKAAINRSGDTVNVLIGTDDYDEKETVIDLTKGEYAGAKEVVISIPARVATSYLAKDVKVILSDMYVKFNPTAFNVSKLYESKDKDKSGVKFKIGINQKNDTTSLSSEYELKADVFIGEDSTSIDYLKNNMDISLDFDSGKADLRRMRNISLRRYDEYKNEWTYVKQRMDNYSTSINSPVNRLGRYSIIGSRR